MPLELGAGGQFSKVFLYVYDLLEICFIQSDPLGILIKLRYVHSLTTNTYYSS